MKVYPCYTYNEKHKQILIIIVDDYKAARNWLHNRVDRIVEKNRLMARYLLAHSKAERDRTFKAWYRFAKRHNLYLHEDTDQPFHHTWEMNKEGSVELLL